MRHNTQSTHLEEELDTPLQGIVNILAIIGAAFLCGGLIWWWLSIAAEKVAGVI